MSMFRSDPIAAIATASGRGAVGIVRLSGPNLSSLIQPLLGREIKARYATYLPFLDAQGHVIDHGLAIYFPAPYSYTGEDVLELQAHGGTIVLQLLLARCLEVGSTLQMRLAQPGEFTQRAFLNDKLDLAQAEAVADLIDASTEAAARSASRSLSGEFSDKINHLRGTLIRLRMLVEATLDFPEEEIDFLQKADAQGQLRELISDLQRVRHHSHQGALLREGMVVVLAGQPNVGKSSLLNALAGAERAIVTPIPGTTRDKITETIQIQGVPVHVVDTAGLRNAEDEVERIGVERSWQAISEADAVIFLHDAARLADATYQQTDAEIALQLKNSIVDHSRLLHVLNKCDLVDESVSVQTPSDHLQFAGLRISARTTEGLDRLRQTLLDLAGWQSATEGLFIARKRHVHALRTCADHLETAQSILVQQAGAELDLLAEELRLAQQSLGEITGEFSADDLLGEIFSRFCIGK